jgi:hypothetical protein
MDRPKTFGNLDSKAKRRYLHFRDCPGAASKAGQRSLFTMTPEARLRRATDAGEANARRIAELKGVPVWRPTR